MKHLKGIFLALFASSALSADEIPLSFNRDIRPILSDNCFGCHGTDAHDAKAGLQLHSFELATTARIGKKMDRQALVPRRPGSERVVETRQR